MSESITGRFRCAAAISGWIEFPPPISSDMIPRNLWPVCSSISVDGAGDGAAVGQALLADQRRAHVRHGGDPVVVGELVRRHELHAMALLVEGAHVQQPEIGAAAAAGAQHPGADGQRFDVVESDVA